MSNIKVSVRWERGAVFAGEDVECIITFKNVATASGRSRSPSPNSQARGLGSDRDRWRLDRSNSSASRTSQPSRVTPNGPPQRGLGHRSTLSMTGNGTVSREIPVSFTTKPKDKSQPSQHKHKRSLSIVSIGSSTAASNDAVKTEPVAEIRPTRTHGRAASFQGVSRRVEQLSGMASPPIAPGGGFSSTRSSTMPYPISKDPQASSKIDEVTGTAAVPHNSSQRESIQAKQPREHVDERSPKFQFPPVESPIENGHVSKPQHNSDDFGASNERGTGRGTPKVLSPTSNTGTPRSSTEFYSVSNNSQETLASEYVVPIFNRSAFSGHSRQQSHLAPITSHARSMETLMMGYVQLAGGFSLDGSLVNLGPFESVKRRGVIGGQGGGGVVGVESSKRESGLFGALGLGGLGQSLGGLLGTSELSSIREMKGIASSKSVPIISTPQSILFVDLKLGPGQSKSYSYSHALPRGIPPTHKGRAIKVVYHLVIGTQRAQTAGQQHLVRHVDVPFKVLPGVNGNGIILGHDLMNPHIILQNMARSSNVDETLRNPPPRSRAHANETKGPSPRDDFLSYVENLTQKPRQNSSMGLLSPTDPVRQLPQSNHVDDNGSVKDAIDLAIARANASTQSARSANRFQIQRGGKHVAVIMLTRPAFRLGEFVSAVIDFEDAALSTLAVHTSLESTEVVDPAIALRSAASIYRATRRVHGYWSECTICSRKATATFMIPLNATPEFSTSGIQLEWSIRFEFVTQIEKRDSDPDIALLEEVGEDERGRTMAAVPGLYCESFEVPVPIHVYGAIGLTEERVEANGFSI